MKFFMTTAEKAAGKSSSRKSAAGISRSRKNSGNNLSSHVTMSFAVIIHMNYMIFQYIRIRFSVTDIYIHAVSKLPVGKLAGVQTRNDRCPDQEFSWSGHWSGHHLHISTNTHNEAWLSPQSFLIIYKNVLLKNSEPNLKYSAPSVAGFRPPGARYIVSEAR